MFSKFGFFEWLFWLLLFRLFCGSHETYNGNKKKITEVPFIVALIDKELVCTGALIAQNMVLTSAHCLPNNNSDIKVFVGEETIDENSKPLKVVKKHIHPEYRTAAPYGVALNDIAVLVLKDDVKISKKVKPVEIESGNWPEGEKKVCSVVGYGLNEIRLNDKGDGDLSLHGGNVAVKYDKQQCGCADTVTDERKTLICMHNSNKIRICFGDYGAPMICNGKLAALAHNRIKCLNFQEKSGDLLHCGTQDTVDVYLYIYPHLNWLSEIVPGIAIQPPVDLQGNLGGLCRSDGISNRLSIISLIILIPIIIILK